PFSPHTPVARACGTGRYIERCRRHSVLRELADWLSRPMARSPLIVLVLRPGLLSCRRSAILPAIVVVAWVPPSAHSLRGARRRPLVRRHALDCLPPRLLPAGAR